MQDCKLAFPYVNYYYLYVVGKVCVFQRPEEQDINMI